MAASQYSSPKKNDNNNRKNTRNSSYAPLNEQLPLLPTWIVVPLWFISLALPNLVYSGVFWYDTLHLIKWLVAGIPVAIALLIAGWRMLFYGKERISFKIDMFGVIWLALLAYVSLQATWVPKTPAFSKAGFIHEFLCFACVWCFYAITCNSFSNRAIRPLLWLANINAAINVLFAEIQIRNMTLFGHVIKSPLILPTPYNYIGNTGQQNMFGLWMAICVMSSIYLFIAYAASPDGKKRHWAVTALNLVLMVINIWGLWNSTSRSAIFSLAVGLVVLAFITIRQFGKDYAQRLVGVLILFTFILGLTLVFNKARAASMITKTIDMVENAETFGGRDGIWATSRAMFKLYPLTGVGIGQYKWHYLDAQREMFKKYPDKSWQYTHWAHNEFLQWFCEGGIIGGLLLMAMLGLWVVLFFRLIISKKPVAPEVIWACSLVALISFNAFWTRPFHRIENILWYGLGFAISNRDMFAIFMPKRLFSLNNLTRICGALFMCCALGGMAYFGDGMTGDRLIRRALSTQNPTVQRNLLNEAAKHIMKRTEAEKNLGYHYLQLGQMTNNVEMMLKGFQTLWKHFSEEPHSEQLKVLIDWAQRFQDIQVLQTLASYMKPGTFSLGTQNVTDNTGKVVSAVVLVPLQESGGMHIVPENSAD